MSPHESLRGLLSILIVAVMVFLVVVGLIFLWTLSVTRVGNFEMGVLVVLVAAWLTGVLSTWMWTAKRRHEYRRHPAASRSRG